MPVIHTPSQKSLPLRISVANTPFTRLTGLLGTSKPDADKGLWFKPCNGIHTIGMKYAIDAFFLDKNNTILAIEENMPPGKLTKIVRGAKSVLECAPGFARANGLAVGDRLEIAADEKHKTNVTVLGQIFHWPINICIALLWTTFVRHYFVLWYLHGGILNVGLLLHNTILLLLFLTRRKSKDTGMGFMDWAIPIVTVSSAMMLRPGQPVNGFLLPVSLTVQIIGIVAMILALVSLGKSFGIIPANRNVKKNGAYHLVRHPLYAAEIIFYIGFLLGNFSLHNIVFAVIIFTGQIWRSILEEKLLSRDPVYVEYLGRVKYRFIPYIF
ncbi:DUF192 domain-containing protein [candidate division KSB1 bacterium]|nr:DUF192 domain-containing protein [candidate division KSB1 bacterium]